VAVNPFAAFSVKSCRNKSTTQLKLQSVPVEIVVVTMGVNSLLALVSRTAGIRAKLSYSCSTCGLLLFDFHEDRNILKLKYEGVLISP
jgi:hypothetical protein